HPHLHSFPTRRSSDLIVQKPIPFGAQRRAETAAYAARHYGLRTWRLEHPQVIVEHYTANTSFSATWNTFASDAPDPELRERPGTDRKSTRLNSSHVAI